MTFIVRPDRDEEETRAAVQTVTARIETAGGEVIATAPWNPPRRRMAYPINDFNDGYYVTTVFNLEGTAVRGLENALKLNENVLRFLVIRASELGIQQVQQRAQQAYMAQSQPQGAPDQVKAPAATGVPQPAPVAVENVPAGDTTEAVQPAAAGAAGEAEE
jgi:small subunit ribosomal protein S6